MARRSAPANGPVPESLEDLPYAGALRPHDGVWGPDGDHDSVHFDGGRVAGVDAPGSRFLECAFTGVALEGGGMRRSRFIDVWANEFHIVGTDLAETEWQDSVLLGSVAAGIQIFGSSLSRVVFRSCKLDGINFRDCELTDVTFEDCLLREADFGGARLTRVEFPGTRLAETVLAGATLERADLRGAELGVKVDPASLRGAVVTPAQLADLAPMLADALGIAVEDPPPARPR
ncbi:MULTISPECIES: pentapeptide repeat-containing protein [Actinomadura]|uniref:Pentapeptide repeat-containing protein n=1 Tax=Actinomadura yumaensis TaxID=111807 RepID=A0ABW2CNW9_9ACTN|nr:pentapeptide repeat-containing protein [Actinomadura sp. J1-007]MWK40255.1 pentapeptide repeat-containing protein [Actinomadura sp. J1-007]